MNLLQFSRDYPDPGKISLKELCAYEISTHDLSVLYDPGWEAFKRIQRFKQYVKAGALTKDCADYIIFEFMGPDSLFEAWWRSVQRGNEQRIRSAAQLILSHTSSTIHTGKGGNMDLVDTMTETEMRVSFGI